MATGENDQDKQTKDFTKGLNDVTKGVFGLAGAFAFGKPTIANATTAIASALGSAGNDFVGTIGKLGQFIDKEAELYQTLSKNGLTFNQNMQQARLSTIQAGLSMTDLTKLVRDHGSAFAAMGGSVDEGATDMLMALQSMRQPMIENGKSVDGYSTRLRRLGYDFNDVAESMAQVTYSASLAAGGQKLNQEALKRQTYDYMVQLDGLAKATGKQRDQVEAELRKQTTKGQFKALMMSLASQGEEGQKKAEQLRLQLAEAEALGQGDMFMDVITKGFAGKDFRTQAALMPEFYSNLQNLSAGIKDQNTTADQMKGQYKETFGSMLTELSSERNVQLAMMGGLTRATGAMTDAYTKTSESVLAAGQRANRMGVSGAEAYETFMGKIKKAQDDAQKPPTEGDEGATTKGILMLQEKLIDTAVAAQTQATTRIYNTLNPEIGKFINKINEFDPNVLATKIVEAVENVGTKATAPRTNAKTQEILDALTGGSKANPQLAQDIQRLLNITNKTTAQNAELEAKLDEGARQTNITRRTGSLGMTGSLLEDFGKGTPAILHGKEAVLTEEQLNRLAAGIYSTGATQAASGLRPQMERMAGSLRPQMEGMAKSVTPQLQGMLNTMRPQMQGMAESLGPQMQNMAEQMKPMMEQMASQMQGPMKEMAEQMRGPMEQLAGTAKSQLSVSTKAMKANRASIGNVFKGFKI